MIDPAVAIIGSRFVFDSAALLLWGAGIFCHVIAPPDVGTVIWNRLAAIRRLAVVLLGLAVAAMLPARAASLGDGWASALDGQLVWLMLWNTNVGWAWLASSGAGLTLILLMLSRRDGPAAHLVLAAILLVSTVMTGHAAMSEGWLKLVHQANSALHLLSAGAWTGALLPILLILPGLRQDRSGSLRTTVMRFSAMGHLAVATVGVSGAISAVLILGGLPLDIGSPYQVLLWAKIAVVAIMVGLAITNRYVFMPRLHAKAGALRSLVIGTVGELLLALVAIGLVAWFGTLSPMTQVNLGH